MKLILRDHSPGLVAAWEAEFTGEPDVEWSAGDIFGVPGDALVSPANSFGYMDGGIDLAYLERFGRELQDRLRGLLARQHFGELPVGQAVIVETLDDEYPFLVSAPTMRMPADVARTANAYLALRAALIAVARHNASAGRRIERLICPGLASSIGGMPVRRVARQMRLAWNVVQRGAPWPPPSGHATGEEHRKLTLDD